MATLKPSAPPSRSFNANITRLTLSLLVVSLMLSAGVLAVSRLSPYEGAIVFTSNLEGRFQIYLTNPRRERVINLSRNGGNREVAPCWLADSSAIVFDGDERVMLMNLMGGNRRLLTDDLSTNNAPRCSPVANRIQFSADPDRIVSYFAFDLETSELINLSLTPSNNRRFQPALSPNGRYIVYIYNSYVPFQLRITDLETGEDRLLYQAGFSLDSPRWSPDSTKILFVSNGDLFVIDPINASLINLTSQLDSLIESPVWSPDGRSIVSLAYQQTRVQLYRSSLDGPETTALVEFLGITSEVSFSPDSSRVVFSAVGATLLENNLYVLALNDGSLTQITDNHAVNLHPMWQPH